MQFLTDNCLHDGLWNGWHWLPALKKSACFLSQLLLASFSNDQSSFVCIYILIPWKIKNIHSNIPITDEYTLLCLVESLVWPRWPQATWQSRIKRLTWCWWEAPADIRLRVNAGCLPPRLQKPLPVLGHVCWQDSRAGHWPFLSGHRPSSIPPSPPSYSTYSF